MTKLDLNQVFSYFKSLFIQMFYFNSQKNLILLFCEKKKNLFQNFSFLIKIRSGSSEFAEL